MSDTPKNDLYFGLKLCDPETAAKLAVAALNTAKYEAVPILEYLESLNQGEKQ
jgi:hypothetical protein